MMLDLSASRDRSSRASATSVCKKAMSSLPAFNEADGLPDFVSRFHLTRQSFAAVVDLRLLVVDDGSTDRTLDIVRAEALASPGIVRYLSLAANAGQQAALIAGLCHAGSWADALVTMDADLEHPLEVVPSLVEIWARHRPVVVHAVRRQTRLLPWFKRWPSALFYRVAAALTRLDLAPGQADFRLWDARTVRAVAAYLPHIGSLRVFAAWIPGKKARVDYDQVVQVGRRTRFTVRKNFELAATSIVRFSDLPLKAITLLGGLGLTFSLAYGGVVAVATARGNTVPGYASTVIIVMTMGCLQLLSIGILATYLRRLVFSRDLPPYIIGESDGHE